MSIADLWPTLDVPDRWMPPRPAADVDAAFAKLPAVPELRELYARSNGGTLGRVDVLTLLEFADANAQKYREVFPSAVIFASDGGDDFFFLDTTGALGRGAGAVIAMDRSSATRESLVFAAPDLETFFGLALRGEDPWVGAHTFGRIEIDDMLAAVRVAVAAGTVAGAPYVVASDALTAANERCGVRLPSPLSSLLRQIFDGMRIEAAGVTIWPAARLEPVPDLRADDPRVPAMIWFAEDDTGERYAVVASDWRGLPASTVVQLSPHSDPQAAPVLGRFCAVVTAWVRS